MCAVLFENDIHLFFQKIDLYKKKLKLIKNYLKGIILKLIVMRQFFFLELFVHLVLLFHFIFGFLVINTVIKFGKHIHVYFT